MADCSPHTVSCLLRMKIPPNVPARALKDNRKRLFVRNRMDIMIYD